MIKKTFFGVLAVSATAMWLCWATAARAEMVYGRDQMACFVEAADRDTGGGSTSTSVDAVVRGLEAGRTTRSSYVRSRIVSLEFRQSLVGDLYRSMLGRWPDASGLAYWTGHYSTSANLAASILGSDEYYSRAGGTPVAFVDALHGAVQGRRPSPSASRSLTEELARGLSRSTLARRIWLSEEANGKRVDRMYVRLLRRQPDQAGRSFWAIRLKVIDDVELAVLLMSSAEYLHRAQACRPEMSGRVLVIGDSLTVGATRGGLTANELAGGMRVDALDGRRISDGVQILRRTDLSHIDHIIFALGSNDFRGPDEELKELISRTVDVVGNTRLTWVNVDTGANYLGGGHRFNQLLRTAALRNPNLEVADWDRFIAERPDRAILRHADGVHYSPSGNRVRAAWMVALAGR